MEYLILGFFTGLSLIFAIGPQNIFVIEQGLKKQNIFLVCIICSVSDLFLIFFGIFLFHFFNQYFNFYVELVLNILMIVFLIFFIHSKIKSLKINIKFDVDTKKISRLEIIFKTLSFTYLNVHVYSDTVFFLGNFSKKFIFFDKVYFGAGASFSSFLFFFGLGYLSSYLSKHAKSNKIWRNINLFIVFFMSILTIYIVKETLYLLYLLLNNTF
tara:strand:+ start:139 stop:777 length:639 start_codon:yes stop_codon:yes gene_type:complete